MDISPRHPAIKLRVYPLIKGWALAIGMGAFMSPSLGQERFKPQDQQVVLAASVHAQGGRNGQLRALDQAWRAQPTNLDASLAYARAVFTLGLTEGDLRWFGSAKAALTPWWQSADLPADGFFLRGLVKQGFHEFDAGLADINQAIAKDAQRAEFWSWRFALHLLLADMAAAQQDILEISRLFGPEEGNVYRGILLYRTGKPQPATELLSAALKAKTFQDTSSQDWIGFHLGEALRVGGQPAQALAIWQKQLKANPQSHLLRLSLAEMLNNQGNYRQAKQIVTTESASDALLMQALLASRGLKEPDEKRLASLIDARLKSQEMRQESLIERPKLFYLIAYGKDPAAGLALSIQNWLLQKEPPDALLFIQAALAVNQPRAAEPVLIWAEKTGYTDPELAVLIRQLQSHPRWTGGK